MPGRRTLVLLAVIALLVSAAVPAVSTGRPATTPRSATVPAGFVGMMIDGPLYPNPDPTVDLAKQFDTMVSSGVESLRLTFDWAFAQPYKSWKEVPAADASQFVDVGGIPTRFGLFDQIVGLAAQRRLTVLPVILNAPAWDGVSRQGGIVAIPRSPGPYANFVKALVQRYGPHGSFWQTHSPRVPIRNWQIWNEPNVIAFWPMQPFVSRYVQLLHAAHDAIKHADPGARVVLAGIPNYSWIQLGRIYGVKGAKRLFDVVAVHPYTRQPQGVITILQKARQVMNENGDAAKPMIADEISWPSSLGKTPHTVGFDFATTESGQARNVGAVLPLLGANRKSLNLQGFYYYTWAGSEVRGGLAFSFAGLLRFSGDKFALKPAYYAFRRDALALERCHSKAVVATRCAS